MTTAEPDWAALLAQFPGWSGLRRDIRRALSPGSHGDLSRWLRAVERLPDIRPVGRSFGPTVTVRGGANPALQPLLAELHPWRKGPFDLFGTKIDSEWRSDWKWQRVAPALGPLTGHRVLDVGCGNGYFGWRMLAAGARLVVGVDPMVLYCLQHLAVNRYVRDARNWVLPVAFERLPPAHFDTVLSLGVVYHRRDPLAHVKRLHAFTRPGGRVVVESLTAVNRPTLVPDGRYARMRNVHVVPSLETLGGWLADAGFADVRVVDVTRTTTAEQRTTPWMRFESLAQALDPTDPNRTVEGHPAPVRAVLLAARGK